MIKRTRTLLGKERVQEIPGPVSPEDIKIQDRAQIKKNETGSVSKTNSFVVGKVGKGLIEKGVKSWSPVCFQL